jgi:hypothetical protein
MQHGCFDFQTAHECIHAIRSAGAKPIVRVPIGGFGGFKRLSTRTLGIVVPMVNSEMKRRESSAGSEVLPGAVAPSEVMRPPYGSGYPSEPTRTLCCSYKSAISVP